MINADYARKLRSRHNWRNNSLNTVSLITQKSTYHPSINNPSIMYMSFWAYEQTKGNATNWFISWNPNDYYEDGDCVTYWLMDNENNTVIAIFDQWMDEILGDFS